MYYFTLSSVNKEIVYKTLHSFLKYIILYLVEALCAILLHCTRRKESDGIVKAYQAPAVLFPVQPKYWNRIGYYRQ